MKGLTTEDTENTEAATPETDMAERMAFAGEYMVPTEFARKLERERDEARDIGEKLSWQGIDMMDEIRALKLERDYARKILKRALIWGRSKCQPGMTDFFEYLNLGKAAQKVFKK